MGINSRFWGPHLWIFLHSVAANYPDEPTVYDITNTQNFIFSLVHIIPCSICKEHFNNLLIKGAKVESIKPLTINTLKNRKTLFKWTYDIHNYVNKYKKLYMGEKRKPPPSLKNVIIYYNTKLSNSQRMKI